MDPIFFAIMCFPLKMQDWFLFLKNHFKNGLGSPLILVFFFKGNAK